jgi:PTH1 family peptidyl-tRNA hydrolase
MKLIVGLGNPGAEYEVTRHNIGFMVVEKLARELTLETVVWQEDKKHRALVARAADILLVKPLTFMNKSGDAVSALLSFYKLDVSDLWIIHDDIDLPPGKIRIRENGASGGHNGVDSIIKAVGSDAFVRFRLGVGRGNEHEQTEFDTHTKHRSVISFVLSRFHEGEAGTMKHLIKRGSEAVRTALTEGVDKAMNQFN